MADADPRLDREAVQKQAVAPNLFYDLIVFLTPTVTFLIGLCFGGAWFDDLVSQSGTLKLDSALLFLLCLGLFFGSYEFGRLAETYSNTFVAGPVKFLHNRKIILKNKDYGLDLTEQVRLIGIPDRYFAGRMDSKWTLFFFAIEFIPHVGADLLKRYAWEKLARSSAFTMFALFCISIISSVILLIQGQAIPQSGFGSFLYTLIFLSMYVIWSFDYYRRNCWNNDLLVTTMPVIVAAVKELEPSAADVPEAR